MNDKTRVLFLCTGNSCRSQMAEGWARHLHNDRLEAFSAGIEKHGLNPHAVQVMAEAGVDISRQRSKLLDELPVGDIDIVVTVCDSAAGSCPSFPGRARVITKSFPDPPVLAAAAGTDEEKLDCYRRVRDAIRDFVDDFAKNLMLE